MLSLNQECESKERDFLSTDHPIERLHFLRIGKIQNTDHAAITMYTTHNPCDTHAVTSFPIFKLVVFAISFHCVLQ